MTNITKQKILDVVEDIKERGIDAVVEEGVIISHSTEENKSRSGVDVLVCKHPEIRIDTLKKIVYGLDKGILLSKAYPTC